MQRILAMAVNSHKFVKSGKSMMPMVRRNYKRPLVGKEGD